MKIKNERPPAVAGKPPGEKRLAVARLERRFLSLGKAGRGGIGAPRVGAKEEVALKGDETGERREITGEKSGERMFQIARHEVPKH